MATAALASCGSDESPPSVEKMGEPVIASLKRAADLQFRDYDAALVVAAVNELQPLGKEEALDRVEGFLSERAPEKPAYGLFWVLRVLFEAPGDTGFPPVRIGTPTVPPPERTGSLPRFPIVLAADVPILAVRGSTPWPGWPKASRRT